VTDYLDILGIDSSLIELVQNDIRGVPAARPLGVIGMDSAALERGVSLPL
jgi:hypothetical protein